MKGIILYTSKYGATRRYAQWIAEQTGFDLQETKRAAIDEVLRYDTVILGGGIYASGIAGLSFLKKNIGALQGKKVIVFCVGASPYEETAFRKIVDHNMSGGLEGLPCFYCRGVWDMDGLGTLDRILCSVLLKAVAKKRPEEREIWETALAEAGDGKHDWTDRAYIAPILGAVRQALTEETDDDKKS